MSLTMAMSVPVSAAPNYSDTALPNKAIGYTSYADTLYRDKKDNSSHYVYNQSEVDFVIHSLAQPDDSDQTVNGSAIVPAGTKRLIRNTVKEHGYSSCKLRIKSRKYPTSVSCKGYWSPDSVGSYPTAN